MSRIVLTGASRGIGRATALALGQRRAELWLLGRPSAALEDTAERARSAGARVTVESCALEEAEAITRAAEHVLAAGTPDVLLNVAGVIERARVEELSAESFDRQLAVNLRAPFLLCRAFLPAMRRAGRGRLIHVGSISSTLGTAGASAYCASKWGLVGFMKSLSEELTDSGIMTLAILPGSVDTEMLMGAGFAPRMRAEDVAQTIVYYALEAPLAHNGGVVEMFGV